MISRSAELAYQLDPAMTIAELQSAARSAHPNTRSGELVVGSVCRYWAKIDPSKIALEDKTTALTYADLDRRADTLAGALAGCGISYDNDWMVFFKRPIAGTLMVLTILALSFPIVTRSAQWARIYFKG